MADIEKVIKGSEWCISVNGCVGCPYEDNCLNIEEKLPGQALIRDALELLKEQKNLIDVLIEDQLKKDEEQQAEIERLKSLVKKKNRKIKKLMEDNYLNGGR